MADRVPTILERARARDPPCTEVEFGDLNGGIYPAGVNYSIAIADLTGSTAVAIIKPGGILLTKIKNDLGEDEAEVAMRRFARELGDREELARYQHGAAVVIYQRVPGPTIKYGPKDITAPKHKGVLQKILTVIDTETPLKGQVIFDVYDTPPNPDPQVQHIWVEALNRHVPRVPQPILPSLAKKNLVIEHVGKRFFIYLEDICIRSHPSD